MMHIKETLCNGCGICADSCPAAAIHVVEGKARIDGSLCTECGVCIPICPFNAIVQESPHEQGKPEPFFSCRQRRFARSGRGRRRRGKRR